MKVKEIIVKLKGDYVLRGYLLALLSALFTLAFLTYNFYVGVEYRLAWNFAVSFYYLLLMVIKAILLLCERRWKKLPLEEKREKRWRLFKGQNILLIILDALLIAPIVLLVLQRKSVDMGQIPAIAIAAYTTYKVTMACMQYIKVKKVDDLSLQTFKTISLKEAIVSVITLQNTLIFVFGNMSDMLTLVSYTSAGMLALTITVSILQFRKVKKIKKEEKNAEVA